MALGCALGLAAGSGWAREVAGVVVPEGATVGDAALVLNGAGIRRKFFIKVYVGALYLPHRAQATAAVLDMPGPTRVTMHVLYDEIAAHKLVSAWNDGFEANLSANERSALAPRIDAFNALFDTVREGDEVRLDYVPEAGTQVFIRGQLRGTIPGADFHRALLKVWLGDHPADAGLKAAMLGGD